jgi:glycosyltransferase involved in cell wall biosynthesis
MKRVLHINDFASGGGAEVVMAQTVDLLRASGWQVDVFTSQDLHDRRLTPLRYLDNLVARRALAARLTAFQPDVVHLHNYYHLLSPGILAELARWKCSRTLRVVLTAHDCHLVCPDSGGTWYRGRAMRQPVDPARLQHWWYLFSRSWDERGPAHSFMKLAQHLWNYRLRDRRRALDVVICPSRFLADLCAAAGQPAVHIPNPAPRLVLRRRQRPGRLALVFVGRLAPEKGVCEFLEILPADFDATLTIIGDGSDAERCRDVCRRRGLQDSVRFLGRLPHEQVLAEMGSFHVLVLPSLVQESYGACVIEALSAGTNVLVSDRGAPKEIVQASGIGWVFAPGDAVSLATALRDITRKHREAILNHFDASAFLAHSSEQAYLERLLGVYEMGEMRAAA